MSLSCKPDGARYVVVAGSDVRRPLARIHGSDTSTAVCLHPSPTPADEGRICGTPIQRTSTGDLLDGVRAHYRTVHPGRNLR